MVVQNFKSKNALESDTLVNISDMNSDKESGDKNVTLIRNRNRNKPIKCGNVMYTTVTGVLILLNITFLCISIHKDTVIKQIQDQLDALQKDVDNFKYRFLDDDLLKELEQFQLETYADEQPDSNDFDDINDDYMNDLNINAGEDIEERKKREVMSATLDGVPIITESYAEQKRRNASGIKIQTHTATQVRSGGLRLYDSLEKSTPISHKHHASGWTTRTYMNNGNRNNPAIVSRTSRFMHTDQEKKPYRKIVKKSLLKSSKVQEHVESVPVTVTPPPQGSKRAHRHGRRRELVETVDLIAAQFFGNTSHMIASKHHGYRGNGHLAHPQGQYVDWQTSWWMAASGTDRHFQLREGVVTVRETGLYFVYAQIYYVDDHDLNGYQIICNGVELAQCVTMTETNRKSDKINSCWTATMEYLTDGDQISIRDLETHRYVFMQEAKSYFGLIKIGDLNIKHNSNKKHTIK